MSTRFSEQAREPNPQGADIVIGTRVVDGVDVHFRMEDIATIMRTLLADSLITAEERTQLEQPVPAVLVQSRYYRGESPPAVNTTEADPGPGWLVAAGVGTDAVWRIQSTLNNGVFVPPWGPPEQIRGEQGIAGLSPDAETPPNTYYFQGSAPDALDQVLNNVWWDSDDFFKQYRWDGGEWVPSFAPFISTDEAGNVTGLVRAGEAEKAFVMVASKFQIWDGESALAPFEVIGGVTYIKEAVVRQLAASKIIGGNITGQEIVLAGLGAIIRSDNYVAGVSGWKIDGEGAEFPSLVVRSANIENDAVTRRYGSDFASTGLLTAEVWTEIASLNVVMEAGNTAHISISFGHNTDTVAPFATDGFVRLKRLDGSQVKSISYTLPQGNTLPFSRLFEDTIPTTRYAVEMMSSGGKGGARDITMTAVVFRK